ncbi:MAG: hypothetical protein LCH77_00190 [Actinobacteria bacterium]|nr:hypothetical protein [Actinomycetota bacterium]
MSLLFVKLILAPLIVLIATLLGRRLGPRAAGLFVGLPGTALPFLLTMYLTHGPHAATTTAAGGIAGQLICATYCIVIARTGARLRPVLAALVALAVAIGVGLAALLLNNAYAVALLVLLACVAGLVTWPHDDTPGARPTIGGGRSRHGWAWSRSWCAESPPWSRMWGLAWPAPSPRCH